MRAGYGIGGKRTWILGFFNLAWTNLWLLHLVNPQRSRGGVTLAVVGPSPHLEHDRLSDLLPVVHCEFRREIRISHTHLSIIVTAFACLIRHDGNDIIGKGGPLLKLEQLTGLGDE